jgi:capsule polysaccharide export protein KpsE/RkpR
MEEQRGDVNAPETERPEIAEILLAAVWHDRLKIILLTIAGTLIATGFAFLVPNEYTSIAQLMPPDQATISGISTLSMMGGTTSSLPSISSNLISARTPGQTAIGILTSRTSLDAIASRLDLLHLYHCRYEMDARKALLSSTAIVEDKKTGIISIAVTDKDAVRARDMAKAYIDELNSLLGKVASSSARKERLFLEDRLKILKSERDDTARQLSEFSSHNATIDPQNQGIVTVRATQQLIDQLAVSEARMSELKESYNADNPRVKSLGARIATLHSQINVASGRADAKGSGKAGVMPSLRELPILGATYFDLHQQLEMQEVLYETLTRQYELAKVQEAKELAAIKVLDEPEVAERKSLPHRSYYMLGGCFVSALFSMSWVVGRAFWKRSDGWNSMRAMLKG